MAKSKNRKEPRIVHVEALTPAGYRWLRQHARGAACDPMDNKSPFVVTNDWAQSLAAAGAKEIP